MKNKRNKKLLACFFAAFGLGTHLANVSPNVSAMDISNQNKNQNQNIEKATDKTFENLFGVKKTNPVNNSKNANYSKIKKTNNKEVIEKNFNNWFSNVKEFLKNIDNQINDLENSYNSDLQASNLIKKYFDLCERLKGDVLPYMGDLSSSSGTQFDFILSDPLKDHHNPEKMIGLLKNFSKLESRWFSTWNKNKKNIQKLANNERLNNFLKSNKYIINLLCREESDSSEQFDSNKSSSNIINPKQINGQNLNNSNLNDEFNSMNFKNKDSQSMMYSNQFGNSNMNSYNSNDKRFNYNPMMYNNQSGIYSNQNLYNIIRSIKTMIHFFELIHSTIHTVMAWATI